MELTAQLRKEYERLFSTLDIRDFRLAEVDSIVARILSKKDVYTRVSDQTGVPWFVVAVIHSLEASLNMKSHLHNGDPLTARTVHVPAGRPVAGAPPFSWDDSAVDALKFDHADERKDWSLAGILHFLEGYNGWGYRVGAGRASTPPMRSPYLWSFSEHYVKGKYVADGSFDPQVVSQQAGAATLLHRLVEKGHCRIEGFVPAAAPVVGASAAPAAVVEVGLPALPGGKVLALGDKEELVGVLQGALNKLGFGPLKVDNDFGEDTESAVLDFQRAAKIQRTGKVGPTTWAGLASFKAAPKDELKKLVLEPGEILTEGSDPDKVLVLERALQKLGLGVNVDGKYDALTQDAVTRFQATHGVGKTGKVGPQTLEALKSALSGGDNQQGKTNQRLYDFYSKQANYDEVGNRVRDFYPAFRSNGCVAFMSTALRLSGVKVPIKNDSLGENISLVTKPFSEWLEAHDWKRITNHLQLLPGDIVFTEDAEGFPGYPAHTYMFAGWMNDEKRNALVVDNQKFSHGRNVFGFGDFNFTPFRYALRSPD